MKTKTQIWRRSRHWLLVASVLLSGGSAMQSCKEYDLDERTPEGWGESIYSWLTDQGNYTNTVRLIDDLGEREVLAKTGSKTLFVADDAAFERFFQKNSWGVRSYDQLSLSQKKLLLRGNMIDNSMQLNTLSSVEGNPPREGECMRREGSSSPFDSVAIMSAKDMPDNPYWNQYRAAGKTIPCMTDNSVVTLVQFNEKFLTNKKITNDDYNFLFNNTVQRQPGDASINGVQVAEPNIKCSNGFIHRMAEVITPLPNMAELIRKKPAVSDYNKLLERFCAPYPVDEETRRNYNYLYGTNVDTLYQKRFFSDKSQNGLPNNLTPHRGGVSGLLSFDPEWNSYYTGLNDQSGNVVMQRDMAVMLVPSNQALEDYWNNGAGKALKDYYGTWENVPDNVVSKLIRNNMLGSFVQSVPSKFDAILNSSNDPMGVKREAIDSVWLGCNGAVYLTNRVYSPTEYVSVLAPALINEKTMSVVNWAVDRDILQYDVYLNSLNSYYSFFIPSNNSCLEYVDPCSYGKTQTELFRFYFFNEKAEPDKGKRVQAWIRPYDPVTGQVIGTDSTKASDDMVRNRLRDILETHIVIGNVEDGHEYYRTKGGTEIRVKNAKQGAGQMTVEGSYQLNEGQPLTVSKVYDQTNGGNGKCYVLDRQPIQGTRNTVYDVLSQHSEFDKFRELLEGSALLTTMHNKKFSTAGQNISTFNNYHYTVYVPTNESIDALQKAGKLPTWEQVEQDELSGNLSKKTADSLKIEEFVKYHIQDNALFIGAQPEEGDFETAVIDPSTDRFYRLTAKLTDTGIEVLDKAEQDKKTFVPAKVVTTNPNLYNLMAREYQYNTTDPSKATMIETSSSAVIHLIDKPLLRE